MKVPCAKAYGFLHKKYQTEIIGLDNCHGKAQFLSYFTQSRVSKLHADLDKNANPIQSFALKTARLLFLIKKYQTEITVWYFLVRETGIEPVWHNHTPLKRARLPIPPLSHICWSFRTLLTYYTKTFFVCQYLFRIFFKKFYLKNTRIIKI